MPGPEFKASILWGSASTREDNPKPSTYHFLTQAELDAFLLGVEAAVGWMEYELLEKKV
jgi:hypothetical protein